MSACCGCVSSHSLVYARITCSMRCVKNSISTKYANLGCTGSVWFCLVARETSMQFCAWHSVIKHVDHPGITRTGACIENTISEHAFPTLELGSRRTRSMVACRSLMAAFIVATDAFTRCAQGSPFSQHWWRYLRYAPLPLIILACEKTEDRNRLFYGAPKGEVNIQDIWKEWEMDVFPNPSDVSLKRGTHGAG